jgi:hypothetical protein
MRAPTNFFPLGRTTSCTEPKHEEIYYVRVSLEFLGGFARFKGTDFVFKTNQRIFLKIMFFTMLHYQCPGEIP